MTFPADKREIYIEIRNVLSALSVYFNIDNVIGGIDATDLHTLNTLMGTAIEVQVVQTLNTLRNIWDSHRRWSDCSFQRLVQTFPDVCLIRRTEYEIDVLFGIELKGWFLLAIEGVPSMRYQVSPKVCNPWDIICVIPWFLSDVVSGKPKVGQLWIEQARYVAEWRDYWWKFIRNSKESSEKNRFTGTVRITPYLKKMILSA